VTGARTFSAGATVAPGSLRSWIDVWQ